MLIHDDEGRIPAERQTARDHFIEHDAKRIDVAGGRGAAARDLLRREIAGSADDHPLYGQGMTAAQVCDAEIAQVAVLLVIEHHVGGLQIAVNHAVFVSVGQRLRNLSEQPGDFFQRQRRVLLDVIEQALVEQAHDQINFLIRLPKIDHRQDVDMLQRSGDTGLAFESAEKGGVAIR